MKIKYILVLLSLVMFISCGKYIGTRDAYSISIWGEGKNGELVNGEGKLEFTYSNQTGRGTIDEYVTEMINIPQSFYPLIWYSSYDEIGKYASFNNTTRDTIFMFVSIEKIESQEFDLVFSNANMELDSLINVIEKSFSRCIKINKVPPGESFIYDEYK